MKLRIWRSRIDVRPDGWDQQVPILLTLGWGEIPWMAEAFATKLSLFTGSRRVIILSFPRHNSRVRRDSKRKNYPREVVRQAQYILDVLDELEIDCVHLVTHSASGMSGVVAAERANSRFASIQLLAPAGLLIGDSVVKLSGRVLKKSLQNAQFALSHGQGSIRKVAFMGNLIGLLYSLANPLRGFSEARAAATFYTTGIIEGLAEQHVSPRVILFRQDLVFEISAALTGLGSNYRPRAIIAGVHDALYIEPERIARIVGGYILDHPRRSQPGAPRSKTKDE